MQEQTVGQNVYWNNAGSQGYMEAMFQSASVAEHIQTRMAELTLSCAKRLGLQQSSHVLDLGCGDGYFSRTYLSKWFSQVDAYDVAFKAIERAKSFKTPNINFYCQDLTSPDFDLSQSWDGAFLIGFLHHVKPQTPEILRRLAKVVPRLIVMEPNGNHLMRKALEMLPSYKAAGEDSFRRSELEKIFADANYKKVFHQMYNLLPNQTPHWMFSTLKKLEPCIERSSLAFLCTAQVYGFELKT